MRSVYIQVESVVVEGIWNGFDKARNLAVSTDAKYTKALRIGLTIIRYVISYTSRRKNK